MQSTTPLLDFAERNRNEVYREVKSTHGQAQIVVFNAIRELGTATIEEVASYLGKASNEVSGRFTELRKMQAIQATGDRRLTKRGKTATVWRCV